LFLPFVALQQLAEVLTEQTPLPTSLQEVITAGEQLQITPRMVRLFERLPNCALYNQYGPSESHVVTAFTLQGPPREWPKLPPIGRPIANAQIYLLDPHLQPVPIGVPGELFIGGECLARGYLYRPDLTAERFVPNPFVRDPDARLYKTGDLARWLPDGNIEFLGRIDHQVKIRGYRIELGEIETVLGQHPSVRECVAMTREDPSGEKRLVAYVLPDPDRASASASELRAFLQQKLPDYMAPSLFVFLDALPLTPSGKVNRRALPAPTQAQPAADETFIAPSTPTEVALEAIWCEVLGVKKVGVRDNFFERGGHSLLMTQVISRVREAFQVELPMRRFFESPTIAQLAVVIEEMLVEEIKQLSDDEARRFAHSAG
jgi:acyl-CoA synthetase (AMP-forming)/AMP-acid ligase II/acyl carrier protein